MQLITSHLNTDFDSLASMVAVQKLYPDAVICPPGAMNRRVRDFLGRHGHIWNIQKPSKIPIDQVTLMVVVDTRARTRIGPFAALAGKQDVEVHVYDHHPPTIDDLPAGKMFYEQIGATTTMIVEQICRGRLRVSPEEATLFSMGIYDDTGALTYEATTDRDIVAIARLRQMGADLSMILSRIEAAMPAAERKLLDTLAENAKESYINGAKVLTAWANSEEYIEGLSIFVHKLRDYCDSQVTLAAVRCGKKTCLIVRSAPNLLNVKEFLTPYGGSGHLQAGSATLTNQEPRQLLEELENKLNEWIKPLTTVESVMTSPVLAVVPDASVAEAYRTMLRFGHMALPVAKEGEVLGMMTRKDLDKAHLHGFDRALIRDFMTEGVIAIPAEASINEAHRLMATYSFERLPVLKAGRLVGILTRADLVRALFQTYRPAGDRGNFAESLWMENIAELLEYSFPPRVIELMRKIGEKAEALGMRAYIVGGAVRDILLSNRNVDLDIAVEGDAEKLLKTWDDPHCRITVHGRYKTGTLTFPDGLKVDIATARREFYEYAAAMPEVSSDSLKQDLGRRDFSINAMAVSLSDRDWGTLTDFYGGRRDLKEGILRILHNLSFVEDPSRILRGIRLEQRMGLKFEDNTLRLLKSSVKGGLLARLSGPRVRMELEIDWKENLPKRIAERMQGLGIWEGLFPGMRLGREGIRRLGWLQRLLGKTGERRSIFKGGEWLAYMAAIMSGVSSGVQSVTMDKLNFTQGERDIFNSCNSFPPQAEQFFNSRKSLRNSEVYLYLKNVHPVVLLYGAASARHRESRRWFIRYALSLLPIKGVLTGKDLMAMGCEAGPLVGELLEELRLERMDGNVITREDEVRYIKNNLEH